MDDIKLMFSILAFIAMIVCCFMAAIWMIKSYFEIQVFDDSDWLNKANEERAYRKKWKELEEASEFNNAEILELCAMAESKDDLHHVENKPCMCLVTGTKFGPAENTCMRILSKLLVEPIL